jgi:hypothetical protein
MGAGYYLNPTTGQCATVTTHNDWIRDEKNATSIGLPDEFYHQIMLFSHTAIDEIRILALQGGLIRIRQHKRYTSVQFWVTSNQLEATLQAVVRALEKLKIHPDELLQIDNLCLGESASIKFGALQSLPAVFQHQLDASSADQAVIRHGLAGGS